jgi:hypothetical protein
MGAANRNDEESWTFEHLLAHCEGYRVDSPEGEHGYVEQVIWEPRGSRPAALLVRVGCAGPIEIPLDDVVELRPQGERIIVQALVTAEPARGALSLAGR